MRKVRLTQAAIVIDGEDAVFIEKGSCGSEVKKVKNGMVSVARVKESVIFVPCSAVETIDSHKSGGQPNGRQADCRRNR